MWKAGLGDKSTAEKLSTNEKDDEKTLFKKDDEKI